MKKLFLLGIGASLLAAVPALSQTSQNKSAEKSPATNASPAPKKSVHLTGTIGEDGKTFICDWDHRIWKIANDALAHFKAGQRVQLIGRSSAAVDELFVTSAKFLSSDVTGFHLHDAAFRR